MRVYLIRHAPAVDVPPGARFLDDLRSLTPRGKKRFRQTARAFAEMGEEIESLVCSPALRAVQTAELLARQLKRMPVELLEELRPGASAIPLRDWLLRQRKASIALVGHGHQLRDLARLLLGPHPPFTLKKGMIIRIDLLRATARPRWSLRESESLLSA